MKDFKLDSSEDVIDVRDIIARVEDLRHVRGDDLDAEEALELTESDATELAHLEAILADLAGNGGDEQFEGDWYPITLIRDSYFTEYAREMLEDCDYISKDFPHWIEIDWTATARNIRMDYTSTEIDGVIYWYR
jgi:hypothetical protein